MLCVGEFYLHVDDKYSNRSFFFSPCRRMDLWTKENLKKLIEESDSVNLNEIVDKLDENESKSMINFDEIRANISRLVSKSNSFQYFSSSSNNRWIIFSGYRWIEQVTEK